MSCNSGYTKDGDKTWTCGTDGVWVSSDSGWCGKNCSGTSMVVYISGCSKCDNSESFECVVDIPEITHGEEWESKTIGSYKNIKVGGGCTDDSGYCGTAVKCNNGNLEYHKEWFDFSGKNWEESNSDDNKCKNYRSNEYLKAVCCNN